MKKKETNIEVEEVGKPESESVTWRMPKWVAEAHKGDWGPFRTILDEWAEKGDQLDIPTGPDETTSVCLRVSKETLARLEKEAVRLSKGSKRKWTAGKVARKIYEALYEAP